MEKKLTGVVRAFSQGWQRKLFMTGSDKQISAISQFDVSWPFRQKPPQSCLGDGTF